MKKILFLLTLLPFLSFAQEHHIAHKDSLDQWVIDYTISDSANVALALSGCDSVRYDGYQLIHESSGDYVIYIYGYYNENVAVTDRMVLNENGDYLDTEFDVASSAYNTICNKVICCATCGKNTNGSCGCATESCTGGICDTKYITFYPSSGLSNAIRDLF